MSTFQILSVLILGTFALRDLIGVLSRANGRGIRLLRLCVWSAAITAIINPGFPQAIANLLGIGRGADVVLYIFVLAFLWVSFFLYSCHLRVQRQVTQLARHIAIQEAQPPMIGERKAQDQ